ncbi:MAG: hypothetical protein Q8M94_00055 [Ignavibacteria bacterium]|nr:hypothetical protein [Ignavibacteria bacterium]
MAGINKLAVMLKKTTVQHLTDRQKMGKVNASAKSKEVQPHPQADTFEPHLLLPNRTKTVAL